jgi:sugar lactone lactonase YvrE
MLQTRSTRHWIILAVTVGVALIGLHACSQDQAEERPTTLDNPFQLVENWAQLPNGLVWGQAIAVDMDADGNLYVFHRCSSDTCIGRSEPPLLKFNPSGELVMRWGEGLFARPHGLDVDHQGNIWVTDDRHKNGKGEVIVMFNPEGELVMTIGTPGVSGNGPYTFNGISDVAVATNGDIFAVDGHFNNRVVKYAPDGTFIMQWGQHGTRSGDFDEPHSISIDSQGRVFVADRRNSRVQIFDQQGQFIDAWTQFGRPSGIYISPDDTLYVADSQSTEKVNPGFEMGIYYGSAVDGTVHGFIGDVVTESVTEDSDGNLFSGLVANRGLNRYVRD